MGPWRGGCSEGSSRRAARFRLGLCLSWATVYFGVGLAGSRLGGVAGGACRPARPWETCGGCRDSSGTGSARPKVS